MDEVSAWIIGVHPTPTDAPGYLGEHRLYQRNNVIVYELGEWTVMDRAVFDEWFEWE